MPDLQKIYQKRIKGLASATNEHDPPTQILQVIPNTYTQIHLHAVFSVKARAGLFRMNGKMICTNTLLVSFSITNRLNLV
jgi:hypothetical protein